MPVQVLHLLGTAQPEASGIARIVAALATGLDLWGYRLQAWFLGPHGPLIDELQAAGVRARSVCWWRGVRDPVGAYRFWRAFRRQEFAIVHQHVGSRAVRHLIKSSSRARILVHLHGCVPQPDSQNDVPIAVRGADEIIAASHAVAAQFPALKPIVLYAGVPEPEMASSHERTAGNSIVIGTACRLVPLKGVADLIRAVELLRPEFPALRLEIAGDGSARGDLEKRVERAGLQPCVRFLGWQRDLGSVLQKWDVFALPSLEEGFGMAVLEAMAAGLPVVTTRIGGLPELVEDGRTGYIVPASDSAALARCLRLLVLNPLHRRAMGAAGRERAQRHFSAARMVTETARIYDALLKSFRPERYCQQSTAS